MAIYSNENGVLTLLAGGGAGDDVFKGTTEAWNQLSPQQKAAYSAVYITNDYVGTSIVDTVASGNMNAVTSNAVATQVPFKFGIDSTTGEYGYIKAGADTVTPFKTLVDVNPEKQTDICYLYTTNGSKSDLIVAGYSSISIYKRSGSGKTYWIDSTYNLGSELVMSTANTWYDFVIPSGMIGVRLDSTSGISNSCNYALFA